MAIRTELGKIQKIRYGKCGYQEAMLGLSITLGGEGWGVGADKPGAWTMERTSSTKWTEEDRIKGLGENAMFIFGLLQDAKVDFLDQLVGKPVQCTFNGNVLDSWRILKEVL